MNRVLAPAKLTTFLRVTGRRPDGYHLLEAEMVSLNLCDELELTEGESGFELVDMVDWSGLPGSEPAAPLELAPGSNLVERALAACGRTARCRLLKRIPAGAGLGGGSADAAAVLRWAGVDDPALAVRLGADVPFCLVGGTARVSGIGEVVEPTVPAPGSPTCFLLVTPRLHVSTPAVFAAWDELGEPSGRNGNDLEQAALAAYPELAWWRDLLAAASGVRPRLAGSGGSWFLAGDRRQLEPLAAQVRAEIVAGRESALVVVAERRPAETSAAEASVG